ncbi:hypothetical protein D3C80_1757380 [compost metagenome]
MENLGFVQTRGYLMEPKDLYAKIKELGYNWDELLDTRGYWDFEENKNPKQFMSTFDLLRMAKGEYVPYWYKGTVNKAA